MHTCYSYNHMYNECCKLRCANASCHVLLSLKKYRVYNYRRSNFVLCYLFYAIIVDTQSL